jgi:hypothetical protein
MNRKTATVLAGFVLYLVYLPASAPGQEIEYGNYDLELIARPTERVRDLRLTVPCDSRNTGRLLSYERTTAISSTATKTLLEELSVEARASLGVKGPQGELAFLLLESLKSSRQVETSDTSRTVITEGVQTESVRSLVCFNQEIYLTYDRIVYDVTAKERGFFGSEIEPFEIERIMNPEYEFLATYEESCNRQCNIRGKSEPVNDPTGEQVFVAFRGGKNQVYAIPLYWNSRWELISPKQYLPKEIRVEFAQTGSGGNGPDDERYAIALR